MTDPELLEWLKKDPNRGMNQLIRQYAGLVFGIVRGIMAGICDSSEIEDCVTDVFLKFQNGLSSFRPEASLKTYLGILARNSALNAIRNRPEVLSLEDEDLWLQIPAEGDFTEEIAEKNLLDSVFAEIEKLGHPDADILLRKYYLGQSSRCIAKALNLTVSNVDTRAHRAIRKLREKFEGENT